VQLYPIAVSGARASVAKRPLFEASIIKMKIYSFLVFVICLRTAETRQVREPSLLVVQEGMDEDVDDHKVAKRAAQSIPDVDTFLSKRTSALKSEPKEDPKTKSELREELEDEIKREIEREVREKIKRRAKEEIKRGSKERAQEEIRDELAREVEHTIEDEEAMEKKEVETEDLSNVAEKMLELERKWHAFLITVSTIVVIIILCVAAYFVFRVNWSEERTDDSAQSDRILQIPLDSAPLQGRSLSEIAKMPINILLLLVPLGVVAFYWELWGASIVVLINVIATIPGAYLLTVATEEIAISHGDQVAAVVNVWIGNVPLLVLLVVAVHTELVDMGGHPYAKQKELEFLFGSFTGTALSMSGLVLGICYMVGGLLLPARNSKPWYLLSCPFDQRNAVTHGQTLLASSLFTWFPLVFGQLQQVSVEHLRVLYCAVTLFYMSYYVGFSAYQLMAIKQNGHTSPLRSARSGQSTEDNSGAGTAMPLPHVAMLLVIATLAIVIPTIILCNVMPAFKSGSGIDMRFIGMSIFGIVGCLAHAVAVKAALKGNMDLSIDICLGSAIQIVLLYFPIAVWCAYAFHKDHVLIMYDMFTMIFFTMSSFMAYSSMVHGQSNWLRGIALMTVYIFGLIHLVFIPSTSDDTVNPHLAHKFIHLE